MTEPRTTEPPEPPAPPRRTGPLARLSPPWRPSSLPAWWPLALGILLGLVGAAAYGLLATPRYTATSYVVVVPGPGADSATALGFAQAYGRVATDSAVLTEARAAARMPVEELRDAVRAATSPDAPMVEITGTASSPGPAAAASNAVANALTRTGNQATSSTGVRLSLFAPAFDPTEPTSPSVPLAVAVGGCAGGLVGGLALLAAPRGRRAPVPVGVPAPAGAANRSARAERPAPAADAPSPSKPSPSNPSAAPPAQAAPAADSGVPAPAVKAAAKAAAAAAASVSAPLGKDAAGDGTPEERRKLGRRSAR
ncbi:YveK family protein [Streptomyces mangrovi]|uniref:lipopolysaccharide biosynthesis protein n=1 Tax=Streptomyces mangrovi TaxID=1206892 RepID=UPI00399CB921